MMSCASGNSRRLSIKFMCVTLPYMSILAGDVNVLQVRRAGGSHARFKVLVGHPLRHAAALSFPLARLSRLTRVSCAFALFVVGF